MRDQEDLKAQLRDALRKYDSLALVLKQVRVKRLMLNHIHTKIAELESEIEDLLQNQIVDQHVSPGNIYTLPETAGFGIEWVPILSHSDDPDLWFCVPLDMGVLVGSWDIEVLSDSDAGCSVLRCGYGVWLEGRKFSSHYSGCLGFHYVRRVREVLQALVGLGEVPSRSDVDDDPDYLEWSGKLSEAVSLLA